MALVFVLAVVFVLRTDRTTPPPPRSSDSSLDRAPLLRSAEFPATPRAPRSQPVGVEFSPLDPALAGTGGVKLRVIRARSHEPVDGASVVLHGTGHGGERIRATTRSDSQGRAVLSAVPAGPWLSLHIEASGLAPVVRADVDVLRDSVVDLGEVEIGAQRNLVVRVSDESSMPVAGARVEARRLHPSVDEVLRTGRFPELLQHLPNLTSPAVAQTNSAGIAQLDGVDPGPTLVLALLPDRVPARVLVEVTPEIDPDVPDLILREGAVVGGRVVDGRGEPVPGALLAASDVEGRTDRGDDPPRWNFAGPDGRFEFRLPIPALPGGLWVVAEGHPATWVFVQGPAGDLRIVLADGVPFELTAVDADTGEPVPDARVELRVKSAPPGNDWRWDTVTDSAGRVGATLPLGRLDELRVVGSWRITAYGPNCPPDDPYLTPLDIPSELVRDSPLRVVARLMPWPALPLEGRVVDETGHVVPDAAATDSSWGPRDPIARTDAKGAFRARVRADGSPTTETWLRVLSPGWVVRRPWARVERGHTGQHPTVTLVVVPSAAIRGRVVAVDGTAVARAILQWDGPDHGHAKHRAISGPDGRFVLTDLEATGPTPAQDRDGSLSIAADGFVPAWSDSFRLLPGRTADVGDVVLSRGTTVEGRLLDPSGAPAAGVRVGIYPIAWMDPPGLTRDMVLYATTDSEGRFLLSGVQSFTELVVESRGPGEARTSMPLLRKDGPPIVSLSVRMERGAPLSGILVGADGTPRSGNVVYSQERSAAGGDSRKWTARVQANADGRFRFESVPLGAATLTAHGDRAEGSTTVDAASSEQVRLVLKPSPDGDSLDLWWWLHDQVPGHPLDTAR